MSRLAAAYYPSQIAKNGLTIDYHHATGRNQRAKAFPVLS